MAIVILPAILQKTFSGQSSLQVHSKILIDAIDEIDKISPGFFQKILTPTRKLRPFVRMYLDGALVREDSLESIQLGSKSKLRILFALAGG